MSSELEKKVEDHLKKRCKALGWWTAKFTSPARAGVPDRIVAIPSVWADTEVWFIELKREGGSPTPLQLHTHRDMAAHGMKVAVLAGKAEVDAWVDQWVPK